MRCIAILAGTPDIHHPLYISLKQSLREPVFLIAYQNRDSLYLQLLSLLRRYTVWAFPSNEIALNDLHDISGRSWPATPGVLQIPGTAQVNGIHTSAQLADKAHLYALLGPRRLQCCDKIKTAHVCWRRHETRFAVNASLGFPIVVKPSIKDSTDSFTKDVPAKLLIARTPDELNDLVKKRPHLLLERTLLLQELATGNIVSWFGYVCDHHAAGYQLVADVKSPVGSFGGTTTLSTIKAPAPVLASAINEIASILDLDGIFEIEFAQSNGRLRFFYEINARPILQTSLILQQKRNIFVEYLLKKGFTARAPQRPGKCPSRYWGSTSRYLRLNEGQNISLNVLFRTIVHDVAYSRFFTVKNKIVYSLRLLKQMAERLHTQ